MAKFYPAKISHIWYLNVNRKVLKLGGGGGIVYELFGPCPLSLDDTVRPLWHVARVSWLQQWLPLPPPPSSSYTYVKLFLT